jgi:NAD+ synthase (glutamine-hydrolysing)
MVRRILLAQSAPVVGDVEGNLALCRAALAEGKARNVDLVLLTELVLSGYPPRDLLERDELVASCLAAAEALTRATADGPAIMFGLPIADGGRLYNAAWIAHRGRTVAVARKCLLPVYDVFDEGRYFTPGEAPTIVELDGTRIGVTICEDIWNDREVFPDTPYVLDPVTQLAGVDLIVNLSASPFHAGKNATRLQLVRAKARQAGAPLVYCNMVGGNDELLFDGASLAVRPDGAIFAQGPAFQSALLEVDLAAPTIPFEARSFEEEVTDALVMGVRDYAARCGFRTAVVGLSGGIDSAVVAAIAAKALGPQSVFGVGMPGPFSSPGSVTDAEALAKNLGIGFTLVPIGEIHDAFLRTLAPALAGRKPDVTEENLQARARGTVLMALSNKFGHLLLTTGNKSELAVGYCTLYGDMNGGLAVISDVFKTDVYRIARWLNREREVIPLATIEKPPSAELAAGQKDQDSLPPYEVLDAILRLYVEGIVEPDRIVERGHDRATVDRVVRLVERSEYKRWQAAPGLRVSPKAFGIGRRIPLAKDWRLVR